MKRAASGPRHHRAARALCALVGAVLVLSSVGLVASPPVASLQPRSATVTPDDGLGNEVVTVSWSGFRPTTGFGLFSVVVLQCRANPTSLDDCFTDTPYPSLAEGSRQLGSTGPDGTGTTQFEVRPAANLPRLACSQTNPCSILVFENDGVPAPPGALHPTSVVVPLRFARSQADCPPVSNFDARVDGSASAAPMFYRWAGQLCTAAQPFVLDYTETSSTTGRENFLEGLVDLGVTSQQASDAELAAHPERGTFEYAPVGLTALVVATNMRNPLTGEPLRDIVVTPRLVARLVTDSNVAAFLTDPELRQLNPGVLFPTLNTAAPLLRAERSAAARLLTTWMVADRNARRFLDGNDAFGVQVNSAYRNYPYPQDLFANVAQSPQFLPRTGQRAVALRLFYGVPPAGETPLNPTETAFIGVVDLPTARRFGLSTARLVNAAGVPVAPTETAIRAGLAAMVTSPEGVASIDPAAADPAIYPLVKVDYAMVPDESSSPARAAAVARLLRYAVAEGQQQLPVGYLALPDDLVNRTRAIATGLDPAPTAPPPPDTTGDPTGEATAGGFITPASGFGSGGSFVSPSVSPSRLPSVSPTGDTDATDVEAATVGPTAAAASGGPALPALAMAGDNRVLPMLLAVAGIALLGWGAGELRPAAARARGATGRAWQWVRRQVGAGELA